MSKHAPGVMILSVAGILGVVNMVGRGLGDAYPQGGSRTASASPARSPESVPLTLNIEDPNCTSSGEFPNNQEGGWFIGVLQEAGLEYSEAIDYANDHPRAVSAAASAHIINVACN